MLRLDAIGSPQWQRTLGPDGVFTFNSASAVHPTEDGDLVVVGSGGPIPAREYTAARQSGALVWKVDARGGLVWQRAYGREFSTYPLSIHAADDCYLIAGSTTYVDLGGKEAWVIKLDRQGLGTGCMNVMTAELPWAEVDIPHGDTSVTVEIAECSATPGHTLQRDASIVAMHPCHYGGTTTNYQGLWCKDLPQSESGWGINFAHQGVVISATWFTYDFEGTPLWLSATAVKAGTSVYSGDLIRTKGPLFSAVPFDPSLVIRWPVGTLTRTFISGNTATFADTVTLPGRSTVTRNKQVTRPVFRGPGTVCQPVTGTCFRGTGTTGVGKLRPTATELVAFEPHSR